MSVCVGKYFVSAQEHCALCRRGRGIRAAVVVGVFLLDTCVKLADRVAHVYFVPLGFLLVSLSVTESDIEISGCNCGFSCVSLRFYQVFCISAEALSFARVCLGR